MDPEVLEAIRQVSAPEDEHVAAARARAGNAAMTPTPEIGSLLRWAAAGSGARTAVEIGSAHGVSALWLLDGMRAGGVLTSIEADPHAHALAQDAYAEADVANRIRSIHGDPLTVLPRLSDHAYDLMLVQTDPARYPAMIEHAHRLLRPGAMFVARGVVRRGDHADDLAEFVDTLVRDPGLLSTILPLEDGIALAIRQPDADEG
ncbi:MAG: class I SAM-dependent methyltransferase [Nitriliruptoraceae bacterium]